MNIYEFVEQYISKDVYYKDVLKFEAILSEDTAWLEVIKKNEDEQYRIAANTKIEYRCNHKQCDGKEIGLDDKDVFEHIRNEHPSVEGLMIYEEDFEEVEDD